MRKVYPNTLDDITVCPVRQRQDGCAELYLFITNPAIKSGRRRGGAGARNRSGGPTTSKNAPPAVAKYQPELQIR